MEQPALGPQGQTLEDAFFRKEEAQLLARIRVQREQQVTREQLQAATGITDPGALDRLVAKGVTAGRLAALGLVPLVEVAWASGAVEPEEREIVLNAAKEAGLDPVGQALLTTWLGHPPDRALFDAWRNYVATLCKGLTPEQREIMKKEVLSRARSVAASAGGVLGMGKISKAEEKKLQELATAFA